MTEANPAEALGRQLGAIQAMLADAASSIARGFKAAQDEHERRVKQEAIERSRYLNSTRGKLDQLRATCPRGLVGEVQYSEKVAEFFTQKSHRELDELERRIRNRWS